MPLINFGSDDNPDWRETNQGLLTPNASSGTVWTGYMPGSGGSGEDAMFDPNAGSAAAMQGGSWSGAGAPVALGRINSQGYNGTLFKGADGYYFDGKKLGIDDATAQAWLGGTAEAQKQERESTNFGTTFDKFGEIAVPLFLATVAGGAAGFGPLAGSGSFGAGGVTSGSVAALDAPSAVAGMTQSAIPEAAGMSTTPGLLSSTAGTGANVLSNAGVTGLIEAGGPMSTTAGLLEATASPAWLQAASAAAGGAAGASMPSAPTVNAAPDKIGSDWATSGINPDGTINQAVMNGGMLPVVQSGVNAGMTAANTQAAPVSALDKIIDAITPNAATTAAKTGLDLGTAAKVAAVAIPALTAATAKKDDEEYKYNIDPAVVAKYGAIPSGGLLSGGAPNAQAFESWQGPQDGLLAQRLKKIRGLL